MARNCVAGLKIQGVSLPDETARQCCIQIIKTPKTIWRRKPKTKTKRKQDKKARSLFIKGGRTPRPVCSLSKRCLYVMCMHGANERTEPTGGASPCLLFLLYPTHPIPSISLNDSVPTARNFPVPHPLNSTFRLNARRRSFSLSPIIKYDDPQRRRKVRVWHPRGCDGSMGAEGHKEHTHAQGADYAAFFFHTNIQVLKRDLWL